MFKSTHDTLCSTAPRAVQPNRNLASELLNRQLAHQLLLHWDMFTSMFLQIVFQQEACMELRDACTNEQDCKTHIMA